MIFVFNWLTSFRVILSRSIHIAANEIISFFFMAKQYSIMYIYHVLFIRSSVSDLLGCFHVLATVNSAAMNTGGTGIFLN